MGNTEKWRDQPVLGIATILATVLAMSLADAIVKFASASMPLWQIYILRSLLVIPALAIFSPAAGRRQCFAAAVKGWVLLRGLLLTFMYIAIYAAAPVLSLSVLAAALYTGPLFIALFSALLIGEPVRLRGWAGIALGFIGVLVMLRPATAGFSLVALVPVIAAAFYALAAILTRSKCREEPPIALALALNLSLLMAGTVAMVVIAIWQPVAADIARYPFLFDYWTQMSVRDCGLIAILATLMVAISLGLAKAYQSASPAIIATFDYAYLIFATFWGFVIFSDVPDVATVIGIVLIAAAGLLVFRGPAGGRKSRRDATIVP